MCWSNGRRVDIPSFRVKLAQTITVAPSQKDSQVVTLGLALAEQRRWDTSWLDINIEERKVLLTRLPDESAVPFQVDAQLVIELYAMSA
jgi:small subunit ribosomal protein S4